MLLSGFGISTSIGLPLLIALIDDNLDALPLIILPQKSYSILVYPGTLNVLKHAEAHGYPIFYIYLAIFRPEG